MRFSVVIPLYNKRDHIGRAVQSVLDQAEHFEELIIVDDGSTDGSADVVGRFSDSRLHLLHQENGGEAAARNTGIRVASGTHIAFLDADDRWKPEFLSVIRSLVDAHPDASIYGTNYEVQEDDGSLGPGVPSVGRFLSAAGSLDYPAALARWLFPLTSSSVCVPQPAFGAVGLFDEDLRLASDIDMWVRLSLAGPAAFDPRSCAIYHKDAANRSSGEPAFWEKRIFFARRLQAKLERLHVNRSDSRNLHAFLARTGYEGILAQSQSQSPRQLLRAIRKSGLPPIYVLRTAGHVIKRRFRG
jgi:glycosyltransferase involved in cell wall biosynthesis